MTRAHNALMKPHLDRAAVADGALHRNLRSLLDAGFVERDEVVVFRALADRPTNARFDGFPDLTGYECFVNGASLDQFVDRDFLLQGLRLMEAFEREWTSAFADRPVVAILGGAGPSTTFRFHLSRPDQSWLADDLEGYRQPMLKLEL